MNFGGGILQQENGLGTANMFMPKDPMSQGQYNPLELLQMLMKKRHAFMPTGNIGSVNQFEQMPQAGINYPNFNNPMNVGLLG